jgi:hypothetical protein
MHRYFSTPPVFSAPVASIDRERGIIRGVTMCQVGPVKGHGGFIDKAFLLQIVEDASSKTAGIKARFGHPNMCSTALGTYLGRFKNYSYSGPSVRADLHLDDTARSTPSGDLHTYVLDMAEKNPDMFGASIAFEIAESVFLEEEVEGQKVEKEYFRLKELRATDIVDEPAATNGLFSANTFPGIATQFLDENPQILDLIFSKPDSITEFLSNYLINSNMNLSEKLKQNFAALIAVINPETSLPEPADQELSFTQSLFNDLVSEFPDAFEVTEGLTEEQMAESVKAYFAAVKIQIQESKKQSQAFEDAKKILLSTQEILVSHMESDLEAANSRIAELSEQLNARPSIPLNVTDPALSTSNNPPDETGKHILASMPKDIKRKLSTSTKNTE